MSVRLSQSRVTIPPGGSQSVTVTVANTSTIVEHYTVEAVRLPAGLTARASGVPVQLSVGEQADVELVITAAVNPPPAAGTTMVGVMVSSPHRRQIRRVEELVVEVGALPGIQASLDPPSVSGRRRGEVEVLLRNTGNAALDVDLVGRDPQRKLHVELGASRVALGPGAVARITAVVSGKPLLVGRATRHQIAFTAQPVARAGGAPGAVGGYPQAPAGYPGGPGGAAGAGYPGAPDPYAAAGLPAEPLPPWAGQVEFLQQPMFPPGLVRAMGAVLGVATLAGVLGLGTMALRGAIRDSGKNKPTTSAVAASTSPSTSPTQSASASVSASVSTSASTAVSVTPPPETAATTAGGGGAGNAAASVDFRTPPPGGASASQVIAVNAYPGVTLAAPMATGCTIAGSNLLWIDTAGLRYVAPGHTDPADPTRVVCQDGLIQLAPAKPAPTLSVGLVGVADPGSPPATVSYRVTAHDALGMPTNTDVTLTPGQTRSVRLADGSGQGLVDITVAPLPGATGSLVAVTSFGP